MRRRDTAGLQRLVTERKEGTLGRRDFLTTLAAGAAVVAAPRRATAQKKVSVTMWDTEPNPATRALWRGWRGAWAAWTAW